MSDPTYTGTLTKGAAPNTVELVLRDVFGWEIRGTGQRQPDGSYALSATVGDPGFLRLPAIDGEAP